jgi:hypothetical protein
MHAVNICESVDAGVKSTSMLGMRLGVLSAGLGLIAGWPFRPSRTPTTAA